MRSMSECKAIIFDMDGLMIDTERLALKAWQLAGTDFGFPISDEIFITMVGRNRWDSDRTLVEIFGSDFPVGAVRKKYRTYVDGWIDEGKLTVKSGLLDLLGFPRQDFNAEGGGNVYRIRASDSQTITHKSIRPFSRSDCRRSDTKG